MNVIVFGETGSGKSSLVNLLLGRNEAAVSDGAEGCTFDFQKYSTDSFNLFDTVGLSEGTRGTVQQSFAVKKLFDLLKSLEDGVSLLVLVMKKGRITRSLEENYKIFVNAICMKKVPVVLAVTHCEMDAEPGRWWKENQNIFKSYGWNIKGAVCCCTLNPDKANPAMRTVIKSMSESSRDELLHVIQTTILEPGWAFEGGLEPWLEKTVHVALTIIFGVVLTPTKLLNPESLKEEEHKDFEELVKNGVGVQAASIVASAIATANRILKNL